jgi:hypothetical protein
VEKRRKVDVEVLVALSATVGVGILWTRETSKGLLKRATAKAPISPMRATHISFGIAFLEGPRLDIGNTPTQ